jgi:hypothetical protein
MGAAAPGATPPKSPQPVLIRPSAIIAGCLMLVIASYAAVFYLIRTGGPSEDFVANYLRTSPEIQRGIGSEDLTVKRENSCFYFTNSGNDAKACDTFAISGPMESPRARAYVWLDRHDGAWRVTGFRLQPETGNPILSGKVPPEGPRRPGSN